ncbi:MAG: hypothetical protein IKI97_10410 [Clostridia bacterium]|nr:hypothetical protein [Clostridia bacterium]
MALTLEIAKKTSFNNETCLFSGGEGLSPIENTKRTSPKQAIFSHLIFYISRENLKRAYR